MTAVLGISAFYHDSAAALVVDGEIVAAAQEERFTRKKNDADFPSNALAYCLGEAGLRSDQLDYVAFYEKPLTKFERLLETYIAFAPHGLGSFSKAMPLWLKEKLYTRRRIRQRLDGAGQAALVFPEHHESHAASAFFPSPFHEAAILTLDGVGEWATAACGIGSANRITLTRELRFPHSLGLLYSAFTYYCGFKVNSGEYKLMGLAPYGRPVYQRAIYDHLIDLKDDGSFWLDMDYFNYCQGLTMTNDRFHRLFGGPPRAPESPLDQRHMDLAASIQKVTEEIVLRMGVDLHRQTGMKNLVLAGGVALNCVANGRLRREGPYEQLWIQPASGDAGGALGAALFVWHQLLERPRTPKTGDGQQGSFLGPRYTAAAIEEFLQSVGARYDTCADEDEVLAATVQALGDEKVVGWFHGRTEYGPRALGARSILADARSERMQATVNVKIKFRESFRPFAPVVLREHVHEWFEMEPGEDSPYMLLVAPVRQEHRVPLSEEACATLREDPDLLRRVNVVRSSVPAITHVDYSARVQTVDERHGRFERLLRKFYEKTGCPVLLNTSFNLSWEPIVLTPRDAYHAFMQSDMDVLVLEHFVLYKDRQRQGLQLVAGERRPAEPGAESPWADPVSREPLVLAGEAMLNEVTGARYPVTDGIPRLFVPTEPVPSGTDVTDMVRAFYEEHPFPNYDDIDTPRTLLEKSRAGVFARLLNDQIPYGAKVVEIGCGTGQLTNFLAIAHRTVLGVDACLNSLTLAQRFKEQHGIDRAAFAQMNLLRPALRDGFFDVVISNGVLHHTHDARAAFARISRLVTPGGYLVVGLYNAYSRSLHYARRGLLRITGPGGLAGRLLDPRLGQVSSDGKRTAWIKDQYAHPHETCHTLGEVLTWMGECGLEFVNAIPKPTGGPALREDEDLFAPRSAGTAVSRALSQLASLGSGYREGGFFVMIGRKRREPR